MYKSEIDARNLIAGLSELEKKEFPFALAKALNDTAFEDVQPGWKDLMLRKLDRPTRYTLNAVRVVKAKKRDRPFVEIYIRDEATRGTPPARYLAHHVKGGTRPDKPFENILQRAGIMSENEFAVPGKSYPLDVYGNVPARVVQTVLKDVQASRGEDTSGFSTRESRRKRERRKKKRGGIYFLSRGRSAGEQALPRGIYERILTAFGSAVRSVFVFVKGVRYQERLDVFDVSRKLFEQHFPKRFNLAMKHAIATSNKKKRK